MTKTFGSRLLAILAFSVGVSAQSVAPPKSVPERLGYPANARLLHFHADDDVMSHSVNPDIEEVLNKHWVTSASILVPCPWFPEAARWAKAHPDADLGIHLALNSEWTTLRWGPVSAQPKGSSLLDADGYLPLTTDYVASHARISDVETETHAQVDKAKAAGANLRAPESAAANESRNTEIRVARRIQENARASSSRLLSTHRASRLQRRRNARRNLRSSRLGRRMAQK